MLAKPDPEKLVSFIINSIVDKKDQLTIIRSEEEGLINLEIKIAKEDMGKVVGRSGATIWAIRKLAAVAGANLGKKVLVTLAE